MRKTVLLLTAAFLFLAPALTHAADAPMTSAPTSVMAPAAAFSDAQKSEIENIIKEYLTTKHPEVMAQGLQRLQKQEQEESEAKSKSAVTEAKDRLFNDPHSPIGGNPKGNLTIVEFYDYNCGYCKMSEESIQKLLKEDKNIKFIYKDFPILGQVSGEAAKASLASVKQGKFQAFHDALMAKKDHLSSDLITQTAKDAGVDVEKMKKDMEDQSISEIITANLKLGQDIGVRGTPMFIIGDNIYPGALKYEEMKQAVADARNGAKK